VEVDLRPETMPQSQQMNGVAGCRRALFCRAELTTTIFSIQLVEESKQFLNCTPGNGVGGNFSVPDIQDVLRFRKKRDSGVNKESPRQDTSTPMVRRGF